MIAMRVLLLALLALAACATPPDDGPRLRYAEAASRGAWAALLSGRPTQQQVDRATEEWSRALRDTFACGVPASDGIEAGFVGALEIGAMNAAMRGGGEAEAREGIARYLTSIAIMALEHHDRPSAERCAALARWAPRVAAEGREAVERARRNGLMR